MSDTRVLVTVGTHEQPFQRLLDAVSLVIDRGAAAEWVVQYGVATFDPRQALHAEPYLSHDELLRWNQWADIAFTGGSPGGIFDALAADAEPFLIPRRHQHGEHINDHQVEFADRMAELGLRPRRCAACHHRAGRTRRPRRATPAHPGHRGREQSSDPSVRGGLRRGGHAAPRQGSDSFAPKAQLSGLGGSFRLQRCFDPPSKLEVPLSAWLGHVEDAF